MTAGGLVGTRDCVRGKPSYDLGRYVLAPKRRKPKLAKCAGSGIKCEGCVTLGGWTRSETRRSTLVLLPRIATTLVFSAIFLFGLYSDWPHRGLILFIIVFGATFLGTHEYYNLARRKSFRPSPWPGHLVALAFLVDAYLWQFGHFVHIFITCFWLLLLTQVFFKRIDRAIPNSAVSLFGSIYVGLPLAVILCIYMNARERWGFQGAHDGANLLVFLVAITWASDSGGYLIGKPFGRHKMSPTLSPNKTIEGMFGAIGMALAFAVLLRLFWPGFKGTLNWAETMGLAVLFTVLGTVGDLAESSFKRDAEVKDSGRTYTGHGGMLDIIDSILLCAPVFYLYLEWAKG
jgi:phosphatidate cytidylyltransferase